MRHKGTGEVYHAATEIKGEGRLGNRDSDSDSARTDKEKGTKEMGRTL